jgi:hypothetical protein
MTTKKMTRQEEHDFYTVPDNQTPQGPARRRNSKLSELVPVRFPPETLAKIRDAADADDRSVSAWIRRAVDRELEHGTKTAWAPDTATGTTSVRYRAIHTLVTPVRERSSLRIG